MNWRRAFLDQSAHISSAIVGVNLIFAATLLWGAVVGGALLGFSYGLVREITEKGSIFSGGSIRDMFAWSIGGAIGGKIFMLILIQIG